MAIIKDGKRYEVWGKRKMFKDFAFRDDAEDKFESLCKKHWKRSFYIVDIIKDKVVHERIVHG